MGLLDRARELLDRPPTSPRVSPVDRAWLRMDSPTNHMVIRALLLLEGDLTRTDLLALVRERIAWIHRLRVQIEYGPLHLWDRWSEPAELDLDDHVREVWLPAPGDDAALHELVSELAGEELDATRRPPWELVLIRGLAKGESAVLARVHHVIGDGLALMFVLLSLTDLEPEPRERNPLREVFEHERGDLERARRFIRRLMPHGMRLLLRGSDHAEERRRSPSDVLATIRSLASLVLRRPDSSTVFRGPLGRHKRLAWSEPIPLAELHAARERLGATVNDLVLAAMTGSLRAYLLARGESPEGVELRATVPISLRRLDELARLGNRFGLLFLTLPVGIADRHERLAELRRRMQALEHSPEPLVTWALLGLAGAGPDLIEQALLGYLSQRISFVMTNVPGPEQPLYLAGHRLAGLMFWAPQSGRVGLGVSICSYAGDLRIGVSSDTGLVPDPERIIAGFHSELAAELAAISDGDARPR